jgi:hypothetical protein
VGARAAHVFDDATAEPRAPTDNYCTVAPTVYAAPVSGRPTFLFLRTQQLDRIEAKLDLVLRIERRIMADEQALDDALAALGTQVDELAVAAQAIVDKVAADAPDVDLTDELQTIQSFTDRVSATTDQISAAAAPPTPAEPPAPVEPPAEPAPEPPA